jgi:hypothetical protein
VDVQHFRRIYHNPFYGHFFRWLKPLRVCHRSQKNSTDVSSYSRSDAQARPSFSPCPCVILQGFPCCHGYSSGSQSPPSSRGSYSCREAFLACLLAHAGCSVRFKGLASILEKRVQLVDGVVGTDAVSTEAWSLSGWCT